MLPNLLVWRNDSTVAVTVAAVYFGGGADFFLLWGGGGARVGGDDLDRHDQRLVVLTVACIRFKGGR